MKPVIVLGAGGHARVLLDALRQLKVEVIGATDIAPAQVDDGKLGVPLLGTDDKVKDFQPGEIELVNGLGTTGVSPHREDLFRRFKQLGFSFRSVIHPSAVIAENVVLHEGVQIMAGAVLQTGSVIEENVIVNTRASVDHDAHVEAHSHVAPGAILCGDVSVGRGCHIGAGAVLVQGAKVKAQVLVKAGSLVKP